MSKRKLILVTGAPRSGTTPVGEVLALSRGACELYEPMYASTGDDLINHVFEVVGAEFPVEKLCLFIERLRHLRCRLKIPPKGGERRRLFSRTRATYLKAKLNPLAKTVVWKDPFAVFAASYLSRELNIPTVVTVRQPFALMASFKRMGWTAPNQSLFMRMEAAGLPLSDEVRRLGLLERSPSYDATVLWNLIYTVVLHSIREGAPFLPINLDDVVGSPIPTYRRILEYVGLEWSQRIDRELHRRHSVDNGANVQLPQRAHIKDRNVSDVNGYWQGLVNEEERIFCEGLNARLWVELRLAAANYGYSRASESCSGISAGNPCMRAPR